MTEATRKAIVALVAVDETATVEERDRIAFALAGKFRVFSVTEVSEMLGLSRPTVYDMLKKGEIKRTSRGQITEWSINEYLHGVKEERQAV